ncbi:MAG TPA: carbamoyl-phosphate synthase large subunit, partial [Arenibacter sp.]|nr:carbamoyl-phosphate synthase large subunit [Arenibacter sp.]
KGYTNYDEIISKLTIPSWDRVFVIYDAIQLGIPLSRIHEITKIDMWFLKQYEELYQLEKEISNFNVETLSKDLLLEAKQKGFADRQIAHMLDCYESEVYNKRVALNINRIYKLVDTCAAE